MATETPIDPKLCLYRFVFEHARDATVVFDDRGRTLLLNRAARALPEDLTERLGSADGPHAAALESFWADLIAHGRAHAEIVASGRTLALEGRRHGDQRVVTLRDVSEQSAFEAELRKLERVESVGYLTANLAHDLNNLLTPIAFLSSCLEADPSLSAGAREVAHEIRITADRASSLARQTLRFTRREPTPIAPASINHVLRDVKPLIERVAGRDLEVVLKLTANPCAVRIDRERLEHTVLNLVANARDAMPAGGRITVSTARVSLESDAEGTLGSVPGSYVSVCVSDTGIGMTTEVREHIFERFFTTKGPGHGTGLGLESVRRFVDASGGCIGVHSEVGQGTTIALYFPCAAPTDEAPGVSGVHALGDRAQAG
jgi:signal transduction histidine kinase